MTPARGTPGHEGDKPMRAVFVDASETLAEVARRLDEA